MANYSTHTLVQQPLPLADMTALEKLVLGAVFETQKTDTTLSCFAWNSVNDVPALPAAAVRDALAQSNGTPSRLHDLVIAEMASIGTDAATIDLDLSMMGYEFILQDIVRRSTTLTHVSITAAFTCSKMRTDGFGGMVTLATPDEIISESTNGLLEKWLADAFP